ncbi:DUF1989 domain-containing protein [Amylibacter sp.]|nr:DUF1989 domain-containing protein [Amylibacter sp.]
MPTDAKKRKAIKPVICYPINSLQDYDCDFYNSLKKDMQFIKKIIIPPRSASTIEVPAGCIFRILSVGGPQVGDLNLWNMNNLDEKFYSGKTRALHGTHVGVGDKLWSNFPYMRPMATIITDTLDWYGFDQDGGSVHDVIGTRCDPYTNNLLSGKQYHNCCHSNLTRALAASQNLSLTAAEQLIHDVLNVFMCTGFTQDTHQYFMKASPVRPGDYLEMFAETDILVGLSTCPGGDCSSEHSSDTVECYPLVIEVYEPARDLSNWESSRLNEYNRTHGI